MAENLGIRIKASLDEQLSLNQINADLKKLASKIESLDLNIDVKGLSNEVRKEVEKINKSSGSNKIDPVKVDSTQIKKDFSEIGRAIDQYEKEFQSSTTSVVKNVDQQSQEIKSLLVTMKDAQNQIRRIRLEPQEGNTAGSTVYRMAQGDMQITSRANEEREKALRYEQQLRSQIEKNRQAEETKTKQLQEQIDLYQRQAKINAQNMQKNYGSILKEDDNRRLKEYLNSVNRLSTTTPNVRSQMRNLSMDFKDLNSQIKASSSHVMTFGEQFRTAVQRIPIWMAGMTAIYAPLRGIQSAIDQVVMLDTQMTELRRVMDATPSTYNSLLQDSINLSTELGNRVENVNQAMVEFARQGYDPSTLMDLTGTATIASNISEMSTTDAMDTITASMQAFNIEANDSISIIDRLNEVDNNFAIDSATLAQALNKSAATANTFGVTMDELVGQIAAIGITTRESGQIVGKIVAA
ncbi:phage tail tape measure protein [Paraliobacillus ryukyuensis]|uniref:phage tail tape measure protein n=1 Tax=Paraliobacillus ryukyuensis TaxID=200904 RepID=UPI0009A6FBC1|nr:phage tail tape measure protein [Paraliobacillus ryukyuensis]